jgi:prevent-host-death family protein
VSDTPSHLPASGTEPATPGKNTEARGKNKEACGKETEAARRIGIRELRQHASLYVDLVERGYTVDITNRGRLVAHLVPASQPDSPLERLIAAGIIEPAEEPGGFHDIEPYPGVPAGRPSASEILTEMREEERY